MGVLGRPSRPPRAIRHSRKIISNPASPDEAVYPQPSIFEINMTLDLDQSSKPGGNEGVSVISARRRNPLRQDKLRQDKVDHA
jgi:hypothetical protein